MENNLKIISEIGRDDIAVVYIAKTDKGHMLEFVESVHPPIPRNEKWVVIVSTLYGCPVKCMICDAGSFYYGRISKEDILSQIDYIVTKRFPDRIIQTKKFKVQFARMGEPSFNLSVLDVIEELPALYKTPVMIPSISTIAPKTTDRFFERLIDIKKSQYNIGNFQLQFSIHTTNMKLRDVLLPVKKWDFGKIAEYGEKFFNDGDRKIVLNFAASNEYPIIPEIIYSYFNPQKYIIKLTPLNPTYQVRKNNLSSYINPLDIGSKKVLIDDFKALGYEVLLSIGELEENKIGSNCGQYIRKHMNSEWKLDDGYTYIIDKIKHFS